MLIVVEHVFLIKYLIGYHAFYITVHVPSCIVLTRDYVNLYLKKVDSKNPFALTPIILDSFALVIVNLINIKGTSIIMNSHAVFLIRLVGLDVLLIIVLEEK